MSTDQIYRYYNTNHEYKPTKFDIVGGLEPSDYITDYADLSDGDLAELSEYTGSYNDGSRTAIVIGTHDIPSGFIKSASTAEDRLLKMFGKFNTKIYRPMEKVKIVKIKSWETPRSSRKSKTKVVKAAKVAKRTKRAPKRKKTGRGEDSNTSASSGDEILESCRVSDSQSSDSSNSQNIYNGGDETTDDNVISDEEDAAAFEALLMVGGYQPAMVNDLPSDDTDSMDLSQYLI